MGLGSGVDGFIEGVTIGFLGPGVDAGIEFIPGASLGPGIDSAIEAIPGRSLGPGIDGVILALNGIGYRPLRLDDEGTGTRELREELDLAVVASIARETSGRATLWTDDNTIGITIGGGVSNTLVAIGKAGGGIQFNDGPTFDNDQITSLLSLSLAATVDLTLRSRGESIPVNESGQEALDADFTKTSWIGALNELEVLPKPTVGVLYTNGEAGTLSPGHAVRLDGALDNTVIFANATADDGDSRLIGAVERSTLTAAQARVISDGPAELLFASGEGAGDLSRSRVYLSTTDGLFTLVAPSTTGNVILDVGVVLSSAGYSDSLGGTMLVLLRRGNRRVVA